MGKRKSDRPNQQAKDEAAQAQDGAGSEPKIAPRSDAGAPPTTEPLNIDAPALVPAAPGIAPASVDAVTPRPPVPTIAIDPPKTELPNLEFVRSAPPESIGLRRIPLCDEAASSASAAATASAAASSRRGQRMRRVTPLAASIAIAAAVGAMAGSAATAGLGGVWASPPAPAKMADMRPLRATITRISTELAALKASIDNSGRISNAQFTKLGDRLDRVEHAQAEPAAKLAKLTEAVDRIERRAPAASNDVTGSISAPATKTAAASPARHAGRPILDGWSVRRVYHGAALIQTRYGSLVEVVPGDRLPELGRIENIHRQDGRWVVVTSRGMIVPH